MIGIAEMFTELSQPDEFVMQVQLELFAWATGRSREAQRDAKRLQRLPQRQVHHCCECGEPGHRGRWRGEIICARQARAA